MRKENEELISQISEIWKDCNLEHLMPENRLFTSVDGLKEQMRNLTEDKARIFAIIPRVARNRLVSGIARYEIKSFEAFREEN